MNIPYFDAHCDTLSVMKATGQAFSNNSLHVAQDRGTMYKPWAQFFAIFASDKLKTEEGFRGGLDDFKAQYQVFANILEQHGNQLSFCKNVRDLERAKQEEKTAAFLSVEGAELLDCSLSRLEEAYQLGVRMCGLTWNYQNALSGSNMENPDRGLTTLGRQFVEKCQTLGMIVDVSHLGPKGFWDVAEMLEVPFVASHSNSAKLWPHSRNLTDEQFMAVVKAKGAVGLNLYADFLGEDPDIDTVISHIRHFIDLGGEKTIAIGGDLDGCKRLPKEIHGLQDIWKIADRLLQKNYSESLIYDIFYENLKRVVAEVCVI